MRTNLNLVAELARLRIGAATEAAPRPYYTRADRTEVRRRLLLRYRP